VEGNIKDEKRAIKARLMGTFGNGNRRRRPLPKLRPTPTLTVLPPLLPEKFPTLTLTEKMGESPGNWKRGELVRDR